MDLASILLFAAVIAVANATPGPTILTLIARVLSLGPARNVGFAIGLVAGDVLWLAAAVFGMAALAREAHEVVAVMKYLGAAYLLYLAYKMWTAPVVQPAPPPPAGELGSMWAASPWRSAIPKTMLFYLALLPNLLPLAASASHLCRAVGAPGRGLFRVLAVYMSARLCPR